MLITAIDHIQLTAPPGSEGRLRGFYTEVLGLEEINGPDGLWFKCGDLALHVALEAGGSAARRHVAFRVARLEVVRAALEAADVVIEADEAPPPDRRRFFCRDVVGNRLEFVQRVAPAAAAAAPLPARPDAVTYTTTGEVERVASSADGQWLAAGTSGEAPTLAIWRADQPAEPEVEIELAANAWEMAFSPSGRELACLSEDGSLETWRPGDFESEQYVELPAGSTGLAYSDNGQLLAVGAKDTVRIFRPGLDELHTLRPGLGAVAALAFDAHDTLAVSGEATRIQLWQIRPIQRSAWELLGHAAAAAQICFNPHHPVLAAATEDGQVLWWDVNEGPESPTLAPLEITAVNAIAFSPDGARLACGGESGQLWLWDWNNGPVVGRLATGGAVLTLAFSADGATLYAGGADGRVQAWRLT